MARLTLDLRFVFLERELWALGEYLKTIESQVSRLIAKDEQNTRAALEGKGYDWDDAEVQLGFQDLHDRVTTVIHRLLRNPFMVSLWAAWEAGITQLAADLRRTQKARWGLEADKGGSFLARAKRYFSMELATPLDLDDARLDRLDDLRIFPNAVAHANGEGRAISADRWEIVVRAAARNSTIALQRGYLVATDEYLTQAYSDVDGCIRDLIHRVRGPAVRRLDPR